ncbi:hypothetical protein [Nitrosophilus alvini]|uniref:hypothetical protein n=1 Tax=Nitrosophilus alvini TaxID=2714855 RepID=UPI00190CEEFF|nr:hypothetical protein [Nitrosophilus alvini]
MIIIGHKDISADTLYRIKSFEDIEKTPPNTTVFFDFDIDLMKRCIENSVEFAVFVKDIKEALFANSMSAKYAVCDKSKAKEIQEIAENYLFDTKIIAKISLEYEIEKYAKLSIDGVLFER